VTAWASAEFGGQPERVYHFDGLLPHAVFQCQRLYHRPAGPANGAASAHVKDGGGAAPGRAVLVAAAWPQAQFLDSRYSPAQHLYIAALLQSLLQCTLEGAEVAKAYHSSTLFVPMDGTNVYLIDMRGNIVRHWRLP
jgi:hypothetical protein